MPSVRIYAFAKELGLDNKQLLDICESCGIKGKGSALASLDDAEIAKIKEHMAGGGAEKQAKADAAEASKPAPIRGESAIRPMRQLRSSSSSTSSSSSSTSTASSSSAATPATSPPPAAAPEEPVLPTAPVRNDNLLGGRRDSGVRDLNQRKKTGGDDKKSDKKDKKKSKSGLNVKLAQMPKVKQPDPASSEPAEKVQKPDIALPQDAIAKARSGAAPLEHLTRQKTDKPKKRGNKAQANNKSGAGQPQIFGQMPSSTDRRGRRDKDKGKSGESGELDSGLGSTRQLRAKRRRPRSGVDSGDDRPYHHRSRRQRSGPVANTAAPRKEEVELQLPCTVREFSEAAGVPAVKVLLTTKQLGDETNRTINSSLDDENRRIIA